MVNFNRANIVVDKTVFSAIFRARIIDFCLPLSFGFRFDVIARISDVRLIKCSTLLCFLFDFLVQGSFLSFVDAVLAIDKS